MHGATREAAAICNKETWSLRRFAGTPGHGGEAGRGEGAQCQCLIGIFGKGNACRLIRRDLLIDQIDRANRKTLFYFLLDPKYKAQYIFSMYTRALFYSVCLYLRNLWRTTNTYNHTHTHTCTCIATLCKQQRLIELTGRQRYWPLIRRSHTPCPIYRVWTTALLAIYMHVHSYVHISTCVHVHHVAFPSFASASCAVEFKICFYF